MLEEIEGSPEVAIIVADEVFMTFKLMCLDKLKEIEDQQLENGLSQWAAHIVVHLRKLYEESKRDTQKC